MNGPPRKPPGPPPPVNNNQPPPLDSVLGQTVRGVGEIRKPPGPPTGAPPLSSIKPPPVAPPPRSVLQNTQRPPIDSIKAIETPNFAPKISQKLPSETPRGPNPPTVPPRGPPPRPDLSDQADEKNAGEKRKPGAKAGAISMFEEPDEVISEKKPKPPGGPRGPPPRGPPRGPPRPMVPMADPSVPLPPRGLQAPRPLPPRPLAPGIPEGQPQPPEAGPEKEVRPPPPVRLPPNRNRAPPKEEPGAAPILSAPPPEAPNTEPPFLRGKKKKVEELVYVPRRNRPDAEFEHVSDDEADKEDFKNKQVNQNFEPPKPLVEVMFEQIEADKKKEEEALAAAARLIESSSSKPLTTEPTPTLLSSSSPIMNERKSPSPIPIIPTAKELGPLKDETEGLTVNAFVPPAPILFADPETDLKFGNTLSRGRMSIRCIEGYGIKRKEEISKAARIDVFMKFKLGYAEKFPWKNTPVIRKQPETASFGNSLVSFDILDPVSYVFKEDVVLMIEVWNKGVLKDECLGTVSMSIIRFMKSPYMAFEEVVPVNFPNSNKPISKVKLQFLFERASPGMFIVTLFEARGLRQVDRLGQQDPYIKFSLGHGYEKKTKVIKNGGINPYFAEEEIMLWVDEENWIHNLKVDLLDQTVGEITPIGSTEFSLLGYMSQRPEDAKQDVYDLFFLPPQPTKTINKDPPKEVACGELVMRIQYLPAGKLTMTILKAHSLRFPDGYRPIDNDLSRMDPYVSVISKGQCVEIMKRTSADKDGGTDPVWNTHLEFDIVDQYQMSFGVMNQTMIGNELILGTGNISLLTVFRNGFQNTWISLKQKRPIGGIIEAGSLNLELRFIGSTGIEYPQHQLEVDVFDDAMRRNVPLQNQAEDDSMQIKPPIDTTYNEEIEKKQREMQIKKTQMSLYEEENKAEFSEEEIQAAFRFIDLDRNDFIGAKEIRHILVCMGEMITDEEIDTMISMVDLDGDGQVSYAEFKSLVLHPDPGAIDLHKEIVEKRDAEAAQEKQILAGKTAGLDLRAHQRQKEMNLRETKRKFMTSFVTDNDVTFNYVKNSHRLFLELPEDRRVRGKIIFDDFVRVLKIEPIQEYKELFALFDQELLNAIDFKEFLLSLMNFVPQIEKENRIRFSFEIMDEGKTGFISQKEVEEILRGNHMIGLSSVQRKADTIMKQASKNATGSITANEFVIVGKKFPNILLPAIGVHGLA